eukprot:IDg6098t1
MSVYSASMSVTTVGALDLGEKIAIGVSFVGTDDDESTLGSYRFLSALRGSSFFLFLVVESLSAFAAILLSFLLSMESFFVLFISGQGCQRRLQLCRFPIYDLRSVPFKRRFLLALVFRKLGLTGHLTDC